jgi:lipopolysaccharide/colanic/teichoic acid biosynthesis glycosyltransferase
MLNNFYRTVGKRAFDLCLALPALLAVSPLLALIAVLVKLDSRGPIFFMQDRLGKRGRVFRAFKFRTMTDTPRAPSEVYGKVDGVTPLGYWLRRFKLDELPQLINVVKGDMSVVGPRPALPIQLPEYTEVAHRRLLVLPGLTGLSQIQGSIYLSWPERWIYDAEYVETLSFGLDLRIILRTFAVILRGEEKFLKRPTVPMPQPSELRKSA